MSQRRVRRPSGDPPRPRVVVVTGASSGIGQACALAFAGRGDVVVLAARAAARLAEVAAACRTAGAADAIVVPTDVGDEAAVAALAEAAVARCGRIDVWVAAAAVMAYGELERVPLPVARKVMDTNYTGCLLQSRAALTQFRRQDQGVLILLGSLLGRITMPYAGAYVASKWAVRALARTLAQETRDAPGVAVRIVEPAGVDTPIYLLAANVLGVTGRPPPPVATPQRVARSVLRAAQRPPRARLLGKTSRVFVAGFVALPAVYDALVGPVTRRLALSRRPARPGPGNVFAPRADLEEPTGGWRG